VLPVDPPQISHRGFSLMSVDAGCVVGCMVLEHVLQITRLFPVNCHSINSMSTEGLSVDRLKAADL
jgi:hypothetical protein